MWHTQSTCFHDTLHAHILRASLLLQVKLRAKNHQYPLFPCIFARLFLYIYLLTSMVDFCKSIGMCLENLCHPCSLNSLAFEFLNVRKWVFQNLQCFQRIFAIVDLYKEHNQSFCKTQLAHLIFVQVLIGIKSLEYQYTHCTGLAQQI